MASRLQRPSLSSAVFYLHCLLLWTTFYLSCSKKLSNVPQGKVDFPSLGLVDVDMKGYKRLQPPHIYNEAVRIPETIICQVCQISGIPMLMFFMWIMGTAIGPAFNGTEVAKRIYNSPFNKFLFNLMSPIKDNLSYFVANIWTAIYNTAFGLMGASTFGPVTKRVRNGNGGPVRRHETLLIPYTGPTVKMGDDLKIVSGQWIALLIVFVAAVLSMAIWALRPETKEKKGRKSAYSATKRRRHHRRNKRKSIWSRFV